MVGVKKAAGTAKSVQKGKRHQYATSAISSPVAALAVFDLRPSRVSPKGINQKFRLKSEYFSCYSARTPRLPE
jgi:hypothetical protein